MGLELPGEGLVSNVGVAACVPVKVSGTVKNAQVFRVGFGFRFRPERLDLMSGSCDVAPWSPIPLGGKAGGSARAAQGAPVAAFDLRDALPGMVLAIEGASAPPSVTVAGPGGVRATTPAGGGEAGGVLFLRDVPGRTTYVAVPAPRAGRWSADARAGLVRGDGGPPRRRPAGPRVKARVTGKRPPPDAALDDPGDPRPGRPLRRGGPRRGGRHRHDPQGARQRALRAGRRARRAPLDRGRRRAGRDGARADHRRPLQRARAAAPGEAEAAGAQPARQRAAGRLAARRGRDGPTACGPSSPTGGGCC